MDKLKKSIPQHSPMATTTVILQQLKAGKGQIIVSIPGALTTALSLKKGDEMTWKLDGSRLYLERAK